MNAKRQTDACFPGPGKSADKLYNLAHIKQSWSTEGDLPPSKELWHYGSQANYPKEGTTNTYLA